MTSKEMLSEISAGLTAVSKRAAFGGDTWRDYYQEAAFAALRAFPRYAHLPDSEIVKLCAMCAYNGIRAVIRREMKNRLPLVSADVESLGFPAPVFEVEGKLEELRAHLAPELFHLLLERFDPSFSTWSIFRRESEDRLRARAMGLPVHIASHPKDCHIALALGFSRSKISRLSATLAREGEKVLRT